MFFVLTALAADPVDLVLRGVCDGSTAVVTPTGRLLVAYDEDRSLHLFDATGGDPLAEKSLSDALDVPGSRELDLEASARTETTVWWLGSHGRNRDGNERPARRVLFTTTLPSSDDLSDLEVTRPPVDLVKALKKPRALGRQLTKRVMERPPKQGGLNLEGLEVHPDGGLWVGLRSPLDSDDGLTGLASLVHVAAEAHDEGIRFKTKQVVQLDLGDRGVRSLARDGDRYLILAGPVQVEGAFEIYAWDGASEAVRPLGVDLAGLNPEALVPLGDRWLVLSDDGAVRRTDWASSDADGLSACKDIRAGNAQGPVHPSVYARGRLITIP